MAPQRATVTLVEQRLECASTGVFTFTRPDGYSFRPGQHLTLTLDTRDGRRTETFSHSDAPADPHSRILTRMTGSPFKDALAALAPGDAAEMSGPGGRLVVPEGTRRVAFLVGGVGITPASSIVRDSVARATALECLVFYGNNDESCMPLLAEFESYAAAVPAVRRVDVLLTAGDAWTGERGFITADVVRRHCDPLDGWLWIVSGPPAMVDAMRPVLDELAVPEGSTMFELFTGYK